MILGQPAWVMVVLALALVVGAAVQGVVGLGVGLVAAPVVTLVAPELMPTTLLVVVFALPWVTLWHDHHDIDWRGLAWSLPARLPGTAIGVWLVGVLSTSLLGLGVGIMVLISVLATIRAVVLPVNRGTLATAGLVSGITGTATSIGGPPIALLYQHHPAHQIRSTLAVYFIAGSTLSIAGLAVAGQIGAEALWIGLLLLPALVVGAWLARVIRRTARIESIRAGVVVVCATSALVLVVRSL